MINTTLEDVAIQLLRLKNEENLLTELMIRHELKSDTYKRFIKRTYRLRSSTLTQLSELIEQQRWATPTIQRGSS